MARDSITVLLPTLDNTQSVLVGEVTKQTVTVANGIKIANALANKNNSLHIYVENTAEAAKGVTIKAGDAYPNATLGDFTATVGASKTEVLELVDISRFENKDGSILLDFAAGFTGKVYAVAKRTGILPTNLQ